MSDKRHLTSYSPWESQEAPIENQGRSQTASTWVLCFIQHPADQGPRTKAVLTLTSLRPSNWNNPNKVLAGTSVYPPTLSPGLKKHSCTGCFLGRRANLQATWCPWLSSRVQLEGQEFKATGGKVYRDYFLMVLFSLQHSPFIPLNFLI